MEKCIRPLSFLEHFRSYSRVIDQSGSVKEEKREEKEESLKDSDVS